MNHTQTNLLMVVVIALDGITHKLAALEQIANREIRIVDDERGREMENGLACLQQDIEAIQTVVKEAQE